MNRCSLTLPLFILTSLLAMASPAPAAAVVSAETPTTCQTLRETLSFPRWLGLPMSRLVVNPTYGYGHGPGPRIEADTLPTDIAYYVGETPVPLPGFLKWILPGGGGYVEGPRLPLTAEGWQAGGVTPVYAAGAIRIASTGPYGSLNRTVTVDLSRTPRLLVDVPGRTGLWALKVSDGKQAVDTSLVFDTGATGEFTPDIAAATGWQGTRTFTLKLFAIGGPEKPVTFSRLQFFGTGTVAMRDRKYDWDPRQITTQASSPDGAIQARLTTILADPSTLAERLQVVKSGPGTLLLTGKLSGATATWDGPRQSLHLASKDYHAVLTLNRPARWLGVRSSSLDWRKPMSSQNPDATRSSAGPASAWGMELSGLAPGEVVIVTVRFSPGPGRRSPSAEAQSGLTPAGFTAALDRLETQWDAWLADAPRPLDFTGRAVDSLNVPPEAVRRSYYRSWVFQRANILPPMPENGYAYPQLPTGKPSLWAEGAPHAQPSAQWESFLAMQVMALMQPRTAAAAFEGLMSLVGPDGSLNGEGLPSCHAQTAWMIYQATGDQGFLRRTYPALKRLLLWKAKYTHWVFHRAPSVNEKDQEFAQKVLADMNYARQIAAALKQPAEVQFWQDQHTAFAANFHEWFWVAPSGPFYAGYNTASHVHSALESTWKLESLSLPPDVLTVPERDYLLGFYRKEFNPKLPFLIPNLDKFPDYEDTTKGLFQYGQLSDAAMMADAGMRDVTRAAEFSETYDQSTPPEPDGVRPSIFGSRHAIDDVFWHNGVIADEGLPVLLGMPHAAGVLNLKVRGQRVDIRFSPDDSQVTLEGPGLSHVQLPDGFQSAETAEGGPRWQGRIAPGQEIRLQAR